jgi:NRAMP (natural resistance-associated macrophage protein)-like metal ion transporter
LDHTISKKSTEGEQGLLKKLLSALGPGLITGASDDDPSGIGTYSQAGAQFGFGIGWTMLLTFPLMAAIQEISARVGRITGHGIAGNLCRHYPAWALYAIVSLVFVANAINIGADLSAMGDAIHLLIGGSVLLYVLLLSILCTVLIVFLSYERYALILRWLTLSLFAYVAALFAVQINWEEALLGLVVPKVVWSKEFFTTLLAIFGTTISPYLFFWQASQEAEEQRIAPDQRPLVETPGEARGEFQRIRADTLIGMAFSNLIAIAIIFTTAATLHQSGTTDIQSSTQAAEALRPVAGNFAFVLFALGIVGTGLLAVPVLAGSAAYAIGEAFKWRVGLSRKPQHATAFYLILAATTGAGVAVTLSGIDPIKALYWSAVINGIVAVPIMIVMMLMIAKSEIMGKLVIKGWLRGLGWLSTAVMAVCAAGMMLASL